MLYYACIYLKYNTKENVVIKQIRVWQTCRNVPYQPSDFTGRKVVKKREALGVLMKPKGFKLFYDNHMSLLRFGI